MLPLRTDFLYWNTICFFVVFIRTIFGKIRKNNFDLSLRHIAVGEIVTNVTYLKWIKLS